MNDFFNPFEISLKSVLIFKIIKSLFNEFDKPICLIPLLINFYSSNLIFVISYSKLICVILFLSTYN